MCLDRHYKLKWTIPSEGRGVHFFQELEIAIYPILRSSLEFGDSKDKKQVIRKVTEDEDVLFIWEILAVHLSAMESSDVLYKIVI